MKIKRYIMVILFFLPMSIQLYAQCNEKLLDIAQATLGDDASIIRPYMIKLKAGNIERPVPTGKFKAQLNRGSTYRFGVSSDPKEEGKAVLQIYDQHILLGSTFDLYTKEDQGAFEFECERTKTYDVVMFFREGKAGCAAGVLSSIANTNITADPISLTANMINSDTAVLKPLYIGMDNLLFIANTPSRSGIKVSIDNGDISTNEQGDYVARVYEPGETIITVTTKYKGDQEDEESILRFMAQEKPLPTITLNDFSTKSLIDLASFDGENPKLRLMSDIYAVDDYRIKSFTIKLNAQPIGYKNYGHRMTNRNWAIVKKAYSGQVISFNNIIIISPSGEELMAPPLEFTIE